MQVNIVVDINSPIAEVWRLVADDFTSIQRWSESVITSETLLDVSAGDAPMGGRYCTFTEDPEGFGAREVITHYDKRNYELAFDVEPVNAPKALPIRRNHVRVELTAKGPMRTQLRWIVEPDLKPHAYVLYPLVKAGLTKSFRTLLGELKTYAEQIAAASNADTHAPMAAVG